MDETPANAVEAIVRGGVEDQRRAGVMPRPNDLRKYVQGVVETMERRDAEDRLRIKPKPTPVERPSVERSTADMESEYKKRLARKGHEALPGSWTVTRDKPKQKRTQLAALNDQRSSVAAQRMRVRLRLLRSKPDWAAKIKAINPLALQGQLGPEKQKHAEFLIREIIRASDGVFGPWMAAPARKLHFT